MHWAHISTVVFSSIAFVSFAIFQVFRSLLADLHEALPFAAEEVQEAIKRRKQSYDLVIEVSWRWVMPLAFIFAAFSAGVPTVQD